MTATTAPPGVAHLENPDLITDLTVARDFDLGITGPPLSISMDFIASGLVEMVGGLASGLLLLRLLVVGRAAAHRRVGLDALPAARERGVAGPQHRRGAHRATPLRLRVPARGRRARGEGGAAVRPLRLGDRALHLAAPPSLRAPVEVDPAARAPARRSASLLVLGANALVAWSIAERGRRRSHQPRPHHRVPHRDGRHVDDRVRRLELGTRRRRRAGGRARTGSSRGWPPPARSPIARHADAGRPACPRARSASATSRSRTGPTCPPCSTASTSRSRPAPRWRSSA